MLDIGCGTGIVLKRLVNYGEVYGIDISEKAVKFCKKRGIKNVVKADAAKLPYRNNYFNLVTILDVIEHLDNPESVISEAYRVLRKSDIAIVTVSAFNFLWSMHDDALHHKRRYAKKEFISQLKKYNFKILKCTYYNFLLFIPIMIIRLVKKGLSRLRKQKDRI